MNRLGDLERKVMDVLWDATDRPFSGRQVADQLPDRAYTTVLTILERLRRKKVVRGGTPTGKVHVVSAAASRETYMAALMLEPLGRAGDRDAVVVRFAETVSQEEALTLQRALERVVARSPKRGPR